MIANNIFKVIGDFFSSVLFAPFQEIRFMDNWWVQNMISWIFISAALIGFLFWLGKLNKYQKKENE